MKLTLESNCTLQFKLVFYFSILVKFSIDANIKNCIDLYRQVN